MIINRAITNVTEVRGRTLEGVAAPFNRPSRVTDDQGASFYLEQLLEDCANKTIADRAGGAFDLLVWHSQTSNRGLMPSDVIGEVRFNPTADALEYTATVNRSRLGDEMLEMARDGLASDNSMSYRPIADITGEINGEPLVSRAEIAIRELSLCPTGTAQHEGSKVLVMRSQTAGPDLATVNARLRLLNLR